jgi:hypothetical protein
VNTVGTDPGEFEQDGALEQEKSPRRRIDGQDSQEENREIPLTVGSWRSCTGFNP